MSRAEQVARVLAATTTSVTSEGEPYWSGPLIATGEELYFTSADDLERFIRRILAAADGTASEFIDVPRFRPTPIRHHKPRNLAAHEAYRNRRRA
jgi:hypothetical protein